MGTTQNGLGKKYTYKNAVQSRYILKPLDLLYFIQQYLLVSFVMYQAHMIFHTCPLQLNQCHLLWDI